MSESLLLLNKKNRQLRYGPEATFTRASIAYNSASQQVASGLPRIESKGVMIEEGTTNLLPAGAENFVTEWSNAGGATSIITDYPMYIPGVGNVIAKRIQTTGGTDSYKRICSVSGLSSPHTITVSLWAMSLSGDNIHRIFTANSGSAFLTTSMQRVTRTGTYSATADSLYLASVNAATDLDIVVYAPQIENKPYATSYTPPGTTRAAESLAIPVGAVDLGGGVMDYSNAVINPSAGTVEMDVAIDSAASLGRTRFLFESRNWSALVSRHLMAISPTNKWRGIFGNGTAQEVIDSVADITAGKHRLSIRYSSTGKGSFWVDGVKIGETTGNVVTTLQSLLKIGCNFAGGLEANSYISNLRISSIARTDTEMAYTGRLYKDSHTTFLRNWRG